MINENSEMALSDITKLIKYSDQIQDKFSIDDNLEDWVKAKLNHAVDYVSTVRDYLKFYNDIELSDSDEESINEKWSMKYKRSIDCNNPKGFGQKAHCRARQLRKSGVKTKSSSVKETYKKPKYPLTIKEIYKQAIKELLEDFDSSMAMGSLKQINSDAKELQSMLKPETKLEDWVKSKLNLAGEYLDDIYHHLDHFGPGGRKLDDIDESNQLDEGFKEVALATLLSLGTVGIPGLKSLMAREPVPASQILQTIKQSSKEIPVKVYKVQSGDTLGKIASDAGLSLDAIMRANPSIKNKNLIRVGQDIIIPIDNSGKIANIKPFIKKTDVSDSLYSGISNEDIVTATIVDEAGGEDDIGMQAVLNVIMNRGDGNIKKAASSSLKKYQFSGWNNVARNASSINKFIQKKKSHPKYKRAAEMVSLAKAGKLSDVTNGADHFLNVPLTKKWNDGKLPSWYTQNRDKITKVIGKHEFLKLNEFFGFNYHF